MTVQYRTLHDWQSSHPLRAVAPHRTRAGWSVINPARNFHRLHLYQFPDGGAEAILTVPDFLKPSTDPEAPRVWSRDCPLGRMLGSSPEVQADSRRRGALRARGRVRRYCRANDLRVIVTFTRGGSGWQSRDECQRDIAAFLNHDKRLITPGAYLVVYERGEKHTRWHAHVAVPPGWVSFRRLISRWSRFLNRRHGETGVHRVTVGRPGKKIQRANSGSVASYLAKYLTKSAEITAPRERLYSVALAFVPVARVVRLYGGSASEWVPLFSRSFGAPGGALWLDASPGRARYWGDIVPILVDLGVAKPGDLLPTQA